MCSADTYERAGSFICRRCKMAAESPPDPRDAHIVELEAERLTLARAVVKLCAEESYGVDYVPELEEARRIVAEADAAKSPEVNRG
jgi:hypothetical protein